MKVDVKIIDKEYYLLVINLEKGYLYFRISFLKLIDINRQARI